ncbi:MAG: helix-turn-helix domain-containing protein [Clostridia bacterium]|jgi:predicted DNA-binding transcriptional regulator AlpA|nr:helix-turn-helix domain-containing protein [Clostridia bacterium]
MAKMIGVSRTTAYEMVRIEGFPAIHVGKTGRKIIIPVESFRQWLNSRRITQEG